VLVLLADVQKSGVGDGNLRVLLTTRRDETRDGVERGNIGRLRTNVARCGVRRRRLGGSNLEPDGARGVRLMTVCNSRFCP